MAGGLKEDEGIMCFCNVCGFYSHQRCRGITMQCKGMEDASEGAKSRLRSIIRGRHPANSKWLLGLPMAVDLGHARRRAGGEGGGVRTESGWCSRLGTREVQEGAANCHSKEEVQPFVQHSAEQWGVEGGGEGEGDVFEDPFDHDLQWGLLGDSDGIG